VPSYREKKARALTFENLLQLTEKYDLTKLQKKKNLTALGKQKKIEKKS